MIEKHEYQPITEDISGHQCSILTDSLDGITWRGTFVFNDLGKRGEVNGFKSRCAAADAAREAAKRSLE